MIHHWIVLVEYLVVNEELEHETLLLVHVVIVNEKTEYEMMRIDDLQVHMSLNVDFIFK